MAKRYELPLTVLVPPSKVTDTAGLSAEDWAGMYLTVQQRFEDVCMAVLTKIADGGTTANVIDVVSQWMDGCDCLDDEVIELLRLALAAAVPAGGPGEVPGG